jgi:hypothetical protein
MIMNGYSSGMSSIHMPSKIQMTSEFSLRPVHQADDTSAVSTVILSIATHSAYVVFFTYPILRILAALSLDFLRPHGEEDAGNGITKCFMHAHCVCTDCYGKAEHVLPFSIAIRNVLFHLGY